MDMDNIKQLASILKYNGADVLNGTSKLTLSVDLLNKLNSNFGLFFDEDMNSSIFHVVNNNSNDFWDLKFLHDFVQVTVGLKLTHSETEDFVDILKFRGLKLLELHKVNVNSVLGIGLLRSKLQYLICLKSIATLSDVLEKCGGDARHQADWQELKEAVFRYNNLQEIDPSLSLAPLLHTLDLSHNEITDASPVNYLTNLKHLNLGYNKISTLTVFSAKLCDRLQVLVLTNNFLEKITEITGLYNLRELDLSDNCLIEHGQLLPIASLAALLCLNLEGNPLSYNPQHRAKTSTFLHKSTLNTRFILNGKPLSKSEQKLVNTLFPSPAYWVHTEPSTSPADNTVVKYNRIRHATISDTEQSPIMHSSITSVGSLLTSGEHLETKRRIEELRQHYGEKWLHSEAGSLVQDVLGHEKTVIPVSSTPYGSVDAFIQAEINPMHLGEAVEPAIQEGGNQSEQTEVFLTASETVPQDTSLYESEVTNKSDVASDDDLGDGEESIYLATVRGETDLVFVVITDTHIIEKELSTKERARWPLESFILCEVHENYLQLYFDTVRNDHKERMYELEQDELECLQKTLSAIVARRPPEEDNLTVYTCLVCSSQFSRDKKMSVEKILCQMCKSPLVFEGDG